MARPLWLRLFGENGSDPVAGLRAALMSPAVGEFGAARFFDRIQAFVERSAPLFDRAVPADLDRANNARVLPEQPGLAAAVVVEHDLAAAAPPAPDAAAAMVPAIADVIGPAPQEAPLNAAQGGDFGRDVSLHLNGFVGGNALSGGPISPIARLDTSMPYAVLGDPFSGLVVDTHTKALLPGGPGDYAELGAGPNDTMELEGDYSAGFGLSVPLFVEQVVVHAGSDYNLIADDLTVAAGRSLTINAMPLGDANYIMFDGSAETDGSFRFYGSDMGDVFFGGAGNDVLYGEGGADVLSGGGGSDTFAYYDAAQSSGAGYDILADFDAAVDRIDLQVGVAGFDIAVGTGTLSAGSFDTDLGAALSGLGAGRAVFYAPDAGDLAGTIFLVVDANGVAGYQAGEDYVFALPDTTLAGLSGHTDFFI